MNTLRSVFCAVLIGMAAAAAADDSGELTREQLAEQFPGLNAENITESPVHGLYEVAVGSQIAYVSKDGRILLRGEMIDLGSDVNLTEVRQERLRSAMLAAVDESEMIIFAPEDARHTITVFTDIDCSFCQRMHAEIDEIKALGIRVRYMFYPRSGPDTESWSKATSVWCAADRQEALTRAKLGESVPNRSCGADPVGKHYELGADVGLRGTPAVVSEDGRMLGGYLPPQALLARLQMGSRE